MNKKILSLRMERQHFVKKANEEEYKELYRDLQPGQNVYWNGFGQPPTLSFRVAFDDIEFNGERQGKRELVKGRFAGGNLGWIVPEEMELFAALYRKPLNNPTWEQEQILKEKAKIWTEGLDYDHEPLQYLLIDGEFHGASVGHFRNGPYDLNDVVCDLPDAERRRTEIVEAIRDVNYGKMPERFMGKKLVEE